MQTLQSVCERIDWPLLHQQKLELLETDRHDGIIDLIDNLQDTAQSCGLWEFPEDPDDGDDETMQTTTTQPTEHIQTETSQRNRYIKITDHNGKTRRVYDPDDRLGRKRLCLETFTVYFQVFADGDVIGHLECASRGVYRCFADGNSLGVRFNVTEACDLVMNTHKRQNS